MKFSNYRLKMHFKQKFRELYIIKANYNLFIFDKDKTFINKNLSSFK